MKAYTIEFKRQALELAASLGNANRAALQLGISSSCIYQWQSKAEKILGSSESRPPAQSEQEELQRLRREVTELKKVNHILKSAAAFFSQDHLK